MILAAAVKRLHFGFPACFSRSSCTDRRANNMPALEARLSFALRGLVVKKTLHSVSEVSGF